MDKPKATVAQTTALHLLNLAHSVPLNPLNKVFSETFFKHCDEKSINLPENYSILKTCETCSVLFIPGLTCSVRITYTKRRKLNAKKSKTKPTKLVAPSAPKPRERVLQYRCLQCGSNQIITKNLLQPSAELVRSTKAPSSASPSPAPSFEAKWPPSSQEPNSRSQSPAVESKAKKRSKKRKETHNLLSIISKSKQEKDKQSMSLNLMDFMK